MKLTPKEIAEIQQKYSYLVNYDSDDPDAPIDPMAYIDSNGDGLLHIAAQRGDLRTVELLINNGADANQCGDMGNTALHYAELENYAGIVSFLKNHGAIASVRNAFGQLPGER